MGWVDVIGSDRIDFQCWRAVNTSSYEMVIFYLKGFTAKLQTYCIKYHGISRHDVEIDCPGCLLKHPRMLNVVKRDNFISSYFPSFTEAGKWFTWIYCIHPVLLVHLFMDVIHSALQLPFLADLHKIWYISLMVWKYLLCLIHEISKFEYSVNFEIIKTDINLCTCYTSAKVHSWLQSLPHWLQIFINDTLWWVT